jgi:putative ABC transport system permease protein
VTVTPGHSRGGGFFGRPGGEGGGGGATATTKAVVLDRTDLQVLKGVPGILYIDTEIRGSANVSYLGKSGTISITGVDPAVWPLVTTTTMQSGRTLGAADSNVVVIESGLATGYFSQPVGVNQMINIGGTNFRVVGITADQGNAVFMPIQFASNIISSKTNGIYDSFIVKLSDANQLNQTMTAMSNALMIKRHVASNTQDFSITSSAQTQATISSALGAISAFLIAIAGVSLLVGAVGVANTMFTSVLEKTKEIGIMKAIGARNKDILLIFLFNAALIGLIGGLLGVILGTILSALLPALVGASQLTRGGTLVTLSSIILALSVSTIVGIVSGVVPAYQGSKLKPVDALRYE